MYLKIEKAEEKYLDDISKQAQSISEMRNRLEVAATKLLESENLAIELKRSLKLNLAKLKSEGEKIVELNLQLSNAIGSRDDWQVTPFFYSLST